MADTHPFGVTASDPYGVASAELKLISLGRGTTSNSAAADDEMGEYAPASQVSFGKRQALPAVYKAQVKTNVSALELTVGGALTIAVESIKVLTAKGQHSTVEVNGHKHLGGTGSSHNDHARTVAIPAFKGFGASAFGLAVGVPPASLQSGSYEVQFGHADDDDADGNFLCGTTHGEKHVASFEAVDETDWSIPAGWVEETGQPNGESNQANNTHGRRQLTIVKFVARTAAD